MKEKTSALNSTYVIDGVPRQFTPSEILDELQALCRSTLTPRSLHNRSSVTPEGSALLKTARELGIETKTPDELALMMTEWDERSKS